MTYKKFLPLLVCLTLTACAAQEPAAVPDDTPEIPAITVAPIGGEPLSPDGKWEVVQEGVNEGVTAGGLYPSEQVSLVDAATGEPLWSDSGAYQIHVAWPETSEFAVIARTARTWTQVTVISTATGDSCQVRLPGDEPIPEYTFLTEDWIGWTDENSFELRLDGGDGVGLSTYWCSPREDNGFQCSVLQAVYEKLPGEYDFTHDGQPETVELITVISNEGRIDGKAYPAWLELHVLNAGGETIWAKRHIALQHVGWANLFSCRVDGKDYILDYSPYMGQGFASYGYRLFSLTETGEEVLLKENYVSFDVNFGSPIYTGNYDPAAIGAFMDDVHSYLEGDCDLLVSTQDFNTVVFGDGADFRGDDFTGGDLYAYDGTWEERFAWYREQEPQG